MYIACAEKLASKIAQLQRDELLASKMRARKRLEAQEASGEASPFRQKSRKGVRGEHPGRVVVLMPASDSSPGQCAATDAAAVEA